VAIKSVIRSKLTAKLLTNLEAEITIMKSLKHEHIVQLIDCQQSKEYIHLIMEYCAFGDLSQFIKNLTEFNDFYGPDMARVLDKYPMGRGGGLHEYLVKHFLRQLGMSYSLSNSSFCPALPPVQDPYPSRP
jgi:serine/threonine-protein kinase ULK/ATG1